MSTSNGTPTRSKTAIGDVGDDITSQASKHEWQWRLKENWRGGGKEHTNIKAPREQEQVSLSRSRILALLGQMCLAWACSQVTEPWEIWREGPCLLLPSRCSSNGKMLAPIQARTPMLYTPVLGKRKRTVALALTWHESWLLRPVQFSYAQQLARKGVREQDKSFMGFITSSHDWPTSATGNKEIANPNAHCFAMYYSTSFLTRTEDALCYKTKCKWCVMHVAK